MKRRCDFLDCLPFFNYNYGRGEYDKSRKTTNTSRLGSTLMDTMIKEVCELCDLNIKGDWTLKAHQQVFILSTTVLYFYVVDLYS